MSFLVHSFAYILTEVPIRRCQNVLPGWFISSVQLSNIFSGDPFTSVFSRLLKSKRGTYEASKP